MTDDEVVLDDDDEQQMEQEAAEAHKVEVKSDIVLLRGQQSVLVLPLVLLLGVVVYNFSLSNYDLNEFEPYQYAKANPLYFVAESLLLSGLTYITCVIPPAVRGADKMIELLVDEWVLVIFKLFISFVLVHFAGFYYMGGS